VNLAVDFSASDVAPAIHSDTGVCRSGRLRPYSISIDIDTQIYRSLEVTSITRFLHRYFAPSMLGLIRAPRLAGSSLTSEVYRQTQFKVRVWETA